MKGDCGAQVGLKQLLGCWRVPVLVRGTETWDKLGKSQKGWGHGEEPAGMRTRDEQGWGHEDDQGTSKEGWGHGEQPAGLRTW